MNNKHNASTGSSARMNRRRFQDAFGGCRCDRCGRGIRNMDDLRCWNVVFDQGVVTGFLCPDCQSDDEDLEARVNEAATMSMAAAPGPDGRWRWHDKQSSHRI